jgi:hypothetical protein
MVEGKEGLRCWEESIYMFLSANHDSAFQHALMIGRREESTHMEGRRGGEKRFAEVVQLDGLGIGLEETQVHWGTKKPEKRCPSTTSSSRKRPHSSPYFKNILIHQGVGQIG